jgi:hypothetical protein
MLGSARLPSGRRLGLSCVICCFWQLPAVTLLTTGGRDASNLELCIHPDDPDVLSCVT